MGNRCGDHVTLLYPQKLALTSPTGGGRSVGLVRSRTKATEFSLIKIYLNFNGFEDSLLKNALPLPFLLEVCPIRILWLQLRVTFQLPKLMPVSQYAGFYNYERVASHLPNAHAWGLPFSVSPRLVILNCGSHSPPATKNEPFGGDRDTTWFVVWKWSVGHGVTDTHGFRLQILMVCALDTLYYLVKVNGSGPDTLF